MIALRLAICMFEIHGREVGTEGVCRLLTGVNLRRRKPAQSKLHLESAGRLAATMTKEVIVVGEQHA